MMNKPPFLELSEIISLGLTAPTIFLACAVIVRWFDAAASSFATHKENRTSHQWFIIGVFISFLGQAADNLWWGVAWTAEFLGLPFRDSLFDYGVVSNIPCRQLTGIIAAFCHLKAFSEYTGKSVDFTRKIAVGIGLFTASLLLLIRGLFSGK